MQAESVDFEQITAGLTTKSDKIRALGRRGVPTAEIARYLDIRYQHARNVLVEAGLHKVSGSAMEPAPSRRPKFAWVQLEGDGSLKIPREMLDEAGLEPAIVHVRLTNDGIEVLSQAAALRRAQELLAPLKRPGISEVDEFIADRRREADRE